MSFGITPLAPAYRVALRRAPSASSRAPRAIARAARSARLRAFRLTRAISDSAPAADKDAENTSSSSSLSSSSQRTPSLHDYDEDQYEPVIHDQAPIPRLERAINSAIIASAVLIIDKLYEGRAYPRFYALETVARVPYFSFLSVLHLYETLGFWRRADYLKVHFAETMNEFHHLLIMESMGGDERFVDRFFAQHMAVAYYFIACDMYLLPPRMAYNLSEQVEEHAYHTYDEFLEENEDELRKAPPPPIAVHYYTEGDLFFFDEFQTGSVAGGDLGERRRPRIDSLYDVFVNVRNDEAEHMKTMQFCQLPGTILRAPSEAAACSVTYNGARGYEGAGLGEDAPEPDGLDEGCAREYAETMERTCEGLIDCVFHPGAFGDEEKKEELVDREKTKDDDTPGPR